MKTNPNELVSAYGYIGEDEYFDSKGGLTKREHFASMALQGLLSMYDSEVGIVPNDSNSEYMARVAVKAADHLIAELNKEETK